jgi:hypothetical protein
MEDILKVCSKCGLNEKKPMQPYCAGCISIYAKERYSKKRDSILKKQHEYIEANREQVNSKNKEYRLKNLDKCRNLTKNWKIDNKSKVIALNGKRRASVRNALPKWLTEDELWMIEQAYELAQLRSKVFGFKWHVDHVIPLKGKNVCGLHTPYNLQVIPAKENLKKGNFF